MDNRTHKFDHTSHDPRVFTLPAEAAFYAGLSGCGGGEANRLEPRGAAAPRASVVHRLPSMLGTSRILAVLCVYFTCVGASPLLAQQTNCTAAPSGLVSWWPADGFALDVIGTNNGKLQNGAGYAAGEVGYGFIFGATDAYVSLPNNFFPFPTCGTDDQPFTFEGWFKTGSGGIVLGQQNGPAYVSQTDYVANAFSLIRAAMGTPRPQYQWLTNGIPLAGSAL